MRNRKFQTPKYIPKKYYLQGKGSSSIVGKYGRYHLMQMITINTANNRPNPHTHLFLGCREKAITSVILSNRHMWIILWENIRQAETEEHLQNNRSVFFKYIQVMIVKKKIYRTAPYWKRLKAEQLHLMCNIGLNPGPDFFFFYKKVIATTWKFE